MSSCVSLMLCSLQYFPALRNQTGCFNHEASRASINCPPTPQTLQLSTQPTITPHFKACERIDCSRGTPKAPAVNLCSWRGCGED